jgi:hypothetical protein
VTLAKFDLRLRSVDRQLGEPVPLCGRCPERALWSAWFHMPGWGNGGLTLVLCTEHALEALETEARHART